MTIIQRSSRFGVRVSIEGDRKWIGTFSTREEAEAAEFAAGESLLTKREIAAKLYRSTRWVELRHRDGLPSRLIGDQRFYRLAEVVAWNEKWRQRHARVC